MAEVDPARASFLSAVRFHLGFFRFSSACKRGFTPPNELRELIDDEQIPVHAFRQVIATGTQSELSRERLQCSLFVSALYLIVKREERIQTPAGISFFNDIVVEYICFSYTKISGRLLGFPLEKLLSAKPNGLQNHTLDAIICYNFENIIG